MNERLQLIIIIFLFRLDLIFGEMMSNNLTLDNFNMLSVIGKGSYAKVVLVKKKGENNDKVYAMKILKKKYIEKRKQ